MKTLPHIRLQTRPRWTGLKNVNQVKVCGNITQHHATLCGLCHLNVMMVVCLSNSHNCRNYLSVKLKWKQLCILPFPPVKVENNTPFLLFILFFPHALYSSPFLPSVSVTVIPLFM